MNEQNRLMYKAPCVPVQIFRLVTLIFLLGGGLAILIQPGWAEETIKHPATPQGFRHFILGMSVEQVKRQLAQDPYFDYRGEPDVSFLPETSQYLIECKGTSFIERAYFQFHAEKLYIMTLVLNAEKIDHYTLFKTLVAKYGDFNSLTPEKVTWEFTNLRLLLEKPLSIKYIDTKIFGALKEAGRNTDQAREQARQDFLEQF